GVVRGVGGRDIPVACDTVLLHGDTPGAIALAHRVREELLAAGVRIAPLTEVLDAKAGLAQVPDGRV
ncbi:LamB/YcsF family protein, partial [Streptomyces sp. MCAF7]